MRKNIIVIIAATAFSFIFSAASFGKNCKKGKPCGTSCISIYKTCHYSSVGSSYDGGGYYNSYTQSYSGGSSYAPSLSTNSTYFRKNTDRYQESVAVKRKKVKDKQKKAKIDYKIIKDRVIAKRILESVDVTGVFHKGDIVNIYEESGSWVQVSTGRYRQWIERNTIVERKTK